MTVRLLSASEPGQAAQWDEMVSRSPFADTYYRPGYVRAYEVEGHGRAVALHVLSEGAEFLFPMLLREISEGAGREGALLDAITPYGYGGLLALSQAAPTPAQLRVCLDSLTAQSKSLRLVSLLLRLHPLFQQDRWVQPLVSQELSLHVFGPTTAIPLAAWSESSMRKGRRSDLAAARRALRLTWSVADRPTGAPPLPDALLMFRDLYEQTMDRLGASDFYHFSPKYYAALAHGLADDIAVALAWQGDKVVGGAIFIADRHCAHYHLSGTSDAGRVLKATTLLIREGIEWARARGCERLHLGGGARGADSLFDFKIGFGGEVYEYAFVGLVTDRPAYDRLLTARRATGQPLRPDFFPAYRA